MLASLLRPRIPQQRSANPESRPLLHKPRPSNDPPPREESGSSDEGDFFGNGQHDGNEDDDDDNQPLLPIFSAELLDRIPIYHAQHSIRLLVLGKVETTLSWDQLRSPQVSQFLVKPLSQNIKQHHFSRGTYLALIANCLQFKKDAEMNPGSAGVFRTRALVCELLAMRLLKESSTREVRRTFLTRSECNTNVVVVDRCPFLRFRSSSGHAASNQWPDRETKGECPHLSGRDCHQSPGKTLPSTPSRSTTA